MFSAIFFGECDYSHNSKTVFVYLCCVLRYLSAILLITAFAAQTFNGAFVKLSYIINPDAYAKNCINKAKPKLKCHGKCQVMKKMEEEEKKEQENQERKWENKITVLSSKSFFCNIEFSAIPTVKATPVRYTPSVKDISLSVFHPPQA